MLNNEEFYKAANITINPFRTNPTIETDPRKGIWVGYKEERETLVKFLTRSRADQVGNINFVMVYGEYGTGKSHALLWSDHYIMQQAKDDFNSFVFYVPTLKKSKGLMSFQAAFIEDLVNKSNAIKDILTYKQFLDGLIVDYRRQKNIGHETKSEDLLASIIPSTDLYNLARQIIKCEVSDDVRKIFNPKTDYHALLLFTQLTNLFVMEYPSVTDAKRFKNAVYLLIDEIDDIASVSAKEARDVNDLFRHLYDQCPYCFCLVLGFKASTAELPIYFTRYILDRVTKQIILDFLQPHEAKEFVSSILDSARVDSSQKTGYYPFTEEAIETVVSHIVNITPRKVVDRLQQLIEESRLAGLDPTKELISSQLLDQHNIWEMVS